MIRDKDVQFKLKQFATKIGAVLEVGEVGFGRPCIGFLANPDQWLMYNPYNISTYEPIIDDPRLEAPWGVNAYHKDNCFCVLIHESDTDKAAHELLAWVEKIEATGCTPSIKSSPNGATGMQAVLSGITVHHLVLSDA